MTVYYRFEQRMTQTEVNDWTAENVMGWKRTEFSNIQYWSSAGRLEIQCDAWRPMTQPNHAGQVRDKILAQTNRMVSLYIHGTWAVSFLPVPDISKIAVAEQSKTECEAICMAAVRATH